MLAVSLAGVWAASQPVAADRRWVPSPPRITAHYFLVVSRDKLGNLTAFIRNPEFNAGASIGNRQLAVSGSSLRLHDADRPDIAGEIQPGGTLVLFKASADGGDLQLHRATPADLQWFYPREKTEWQYRPPAALADGWSTGTLTGEGMSEAPIRAFIQPIVSLRAPQLRSPYIQSFAIERHGKLVLDEYFYGFTADQPHDVRSAGKSITTLMTGRAIEDSSKFTPESRVLPLLPQYRPVRNDDERKQRMTVGNLMTMSSGLACNDNDDASPGNEDTMQSQPAGTDWFKYTLDLPMSSDPGTHAVYCTAGINLLGALIARYTAEPLASYFQTRFAAPMQFGTYAMWLMPAPASEAYMGGGDYIRPRDFLKFGELLLRGGRWNGAPIVDPQWIGQSILPRTAPEGEGDRYGYGWHIADVAVDGKSYRVINAGGNGGQLLMAIPELDVAMMLTAGNYNQFPVWRAFLPDAVRAAVRACGG